MSHVVKTKVLISCAVPHSCSGPLFSLHRLYNPYMQNFKSLTIFCGCKAQFVSDMVENPKTGFLVTWLIFQGDKIEVFWNPYFKNNGTNLSSRLGCLVSMPILLQYQTRTVRIIGNKTVFRENQTFVKPPF